MVVLGGRGGNAGTEIFQQGGSGCQVTASLAVELGDEMTWLRGGSGGDTTFSTVEQPGGVGGAGARPGGAGGATSQTFSNPSTPGAGGGGATRLSLNDNELIIAAGGGGGTASTGGGSACALGTPEGGGGFGSLPVAGGGISPELGGVAGLGNGGSANPPPGTAGNSATAGSPPGAGGTGGVGQFGGPGGGGGGGGVSGGGGGAGQNGVFGGGNGTGAAGLSSAPEAPNGVAAPRFAAGGPAEGSVALRTVEITTPSLPEGTTGSSYSATLNADFVEFVDGPSSVTSTVSPANGGTITWSVPDASGSLPAGLTLNPSGSITGTPTATGTENVILEASVLDDSGDVRARSVVDYDIVIAQGTTPTTAPEPTSTTAAAPTTTVPGDGSGTLPATGAAGVAPLVAAGIALAGSGLGLGVLARRRRR